MSENQGYRQRAAEIRQQAREHLNNLRMQRLAKRKPSPKSDITHHNYDTQTFHSDITSHDNSESQQTENKENKKDEKIQSSDNFAKSYPKSFSPDVSTAPTEKTLEQEHSVEDSNEEVSNTADTARPEIVEEKKTAEITVENAIEVKSKRPEIEPQQLSSTDTEYNPCEPGETKPSGNLLKDFINELEQLPFETTGLNAHSSIVHVPTLGEGMVWRLRQLGIETLGDLAAEQPDSLTSRLGTIGTLVRADLWIEFAKNTCEQVKAAPDNSK